MVGLEPKPGQHLGYQGLNKKVDFWGVIRDNGCVRDNDGRKLDRKTLEGLAAWGGGHGGLRY